MEKNSETIQKNERENKKEWRAPRLSIKEIKETKATTDGMGADAMTWS
jgi:hypothetical protein